MVWMKQAYHHPCRMPASAPRLTPPLAITLDGEQEDDGRWLAEVPELPGVMVYADLSPEENQGEG